MLLSVVIATKDRALALARALASLATQQRAPAFEVIVADNGSRDDTRAVAERAGADGGLDLRYLYDDEPNRGKARNAGVRAAAGQIVVFCDDDVQVPPEFLAAHAAAQVKQPGVVAGPILNVASYEEKPRPKAGHYSGAFLCTCNASLPKELFDRVGGFDEGFSLYGWEDTELGLRLRAAGTRRTFAWDAFVWHVKAPAEHTLAVEAQKARERARMARRFLEAHPVARVRMATGAYGLNVLRGRLIPLGAVALFERLANASHLPRPLQTLARAQYLDAVYTRELTRVLRP